MAIRKKKLYVTAMLCAMAVVIGYIFLYIPNVEFITAAVFINGYILGRTNGTIAAIITEFLFSGLNPMGAPAPTLLLAQVMSFAMIGYMGGQVSLRHWQYFTNWAKIVYFGLLGFMLTFIYDVLTAFSYSLFLAGADWKKILSSFIPGMGFYIVHLAVNTISFALIVPVILERLEKLGRARI
jgi:hypothetical protein